MSLDPLKSDCSPETKNLLTIFHFRAKTQASRHSVGETGFRKAAGELSSCYVIYQADMEFKQEDIFKDILFSRASSVESKFS